MVTDCEGYIRDVVDKLKELKHLSPSIAITNDTPQGYPVSSYEEKWKEAGREIYHTCYQKTSG